MRKFSFILTLIMLFFIVRCSDDSMTKPQSDLQEDAVVFDKSDYEGYQSSLAKGNMDFANEIRLKYFAKSLAKNLANPGACGLLKQEIGKKFDGDFDVLWEKVKNQDISGKGKFRKLISNRLSNGKGSFISIDEIENVPLLQISLPVNFEKWDGEKPILVAYTPLTINDTEWEEIYAYDSEGNEHVLDAKTAPDFPVMVIGINERTDDEGNVPNNALAKTVDINSVVGVSSSSELTDEILVYMRFLRNYSDIEPWGKGDPEVRLSISGIDDNGNAHNDMEYHNFDGTFNTYWTWSGRHYDKHWKHPNIGIYTRDPSIYGTGAVLFRWESDWPSGTNVWSYNAGGTTVTTTVVTDGYDKIGTRFISYDLAPSYYGDQSSPCYFGDLFCNVLTY